MAELETYVPLSQAAIQFGLAERALRRMVQDGMVRAIKLPGGEVAVSASDTANDSIVERITKDRSLIGTPIRSMEAEKKYGVSAANLSHWTKAGYIRVLEREHKLLVLDEADVSFCAAVFKRAKQIHQSSIRAGWVLKRVHSRKAR